MFAALNVMTGVILGKCLPRHRNGEFLQFLRLIDRSIDKGLQVHLIVDNYGTHKHPKVNAWLVAHPNVHLHFTPTGASWLNLVEVFFSIITKQAIRRGSFDSVADLVRAIRRFIEAWNERCEPFVWTKDADTLIAKATRKGTSITRH